MPSRSVAAFYVRTLRRPFHAVPRLFGFAFASTMHAIGHALVALVAGAMAFSLSGRWGGFPPAVDMRCGSAGEGWAGDRALFLALLGLGVVFGKAVAGTYASYLQAALAGEVGSHLRLELLDGLLAVHRLHRPRHGDQGGDVGGTARAVAALTERVQDVEGGLEQGVLGGARAAAQLAPIVALLVVLSGRMAIAAGLVLAAFGWVLGRVRRQYRRATQRAARERERLLEAADEAVRHADLWVTYGGERNVRNIVRRLGEGIASSAARLRARAAILSGGNEVLGAAALVMAVAASGRGWLGAAPDGKTLVLFALVFFLAYRPLREIADARLVLARAQGAYEELLHVLDVAPVAPLPERPARRWPLAVLDLRALRLQRGTAAPLTLHIEPGSIIAVTGPTGIGKTTLLRTLLGLDRAAGGQLLFDGADFGESPAGPSARPFVWVPQDAPLLADTLAANVTLGAATADAPRTLESLGASHLVDRLGDERLGAGGRAVSGGERQWIALARAIATEQPVLLLDEPTSGLDAASQRHVLDAISKLRGKRTVIVVTHRSEPLGIADVVVRLDREPSERAPQGGLRIDTTGPGFTIAARAGSRSPSRT